MRVRSEAAGTAEARGAASALRRRLERTCWLVGARVRDHGPDDHRHSLGDALALDLGALAVGETEADREDSELAQVVDVPENGAAVRAHAGERVTGRRAAAGEAAGSAGPTAAATLTSRGTGPRIGRRRTAVAVPASSATFAATRATRRTRGALTTAPPGHPVGAHLRQHRLGGPEAQRRVGHQQDVSLRAGEEVDVRRHPREEPPILVLDLDHDRVVDDVLDRLRLQSHLL